MRSHSVRFCATKSLFGTILSSMSSCQSQSPKDIPHKALSNSSTTIRSLASMVRIYLRLIADWSTARLTPPCFRLRHATRDIGCHPFSSAYLCERRNAWPNSMLPQINNANPEGNPRIIQRRPIDAKASRGVVISDPDDIPTPIAMINKAPAAIRDKSSQTPILCLRGFICFSSRRWTCRLRWRRSAWPRFRR